MRLAELLHGIEVLATTAPEALEVGSVCCDSRKAQPGALFVALQGQRGTGLDHVAHAISRGAVAVVSEAAPPPAGPRWVRVANARLALARLACAIHGHPSHALAVHAVTGTNGKTTTSWLVRDMLAAAGHRVGLITTVQYEYGERVIAASRTTPDACELQELLAAMRHAGCDSVMMEASSHAIDQHRVGGIRFASAAFTNLSRDHLDYHKDFEGYFRAKSGLFTQIAAERPGAPVILNRDDPYGLRLLEQARRLGLRTVSYGFDAQAEVRAEDVRLDAAGSSFALIAPEGRMEVATQLLGRYNVANMLCATGIALAAGVPLATAVDVLRRVQPRWGRLERIETPLPATIFVDYAHTDDALRQMLTALREITRRRLIVVFGCGGDRDRLKRPLMGRAAAELADHVVVTSDNPRSEDPEQIIAEIMTGIPAGTSCETVPDRHEAILAALRRSGPGDVVVIAGKGHENYQEFQHRIVAFDDREQVRSLAKHVG